MHDNECGQSRSLRRLTAAAVAALLGILVITSLANAVPNKDQESTQVYQHTYDEVFQASQEAIERLGYFVTDKNKDKGTVNGNAHERHCSFDIHIEPLNTKPETRATINAQCKGLFPNGTWARSVKETFLSEVQKVLATYH